MLLGVISLSVASAQQQTAPRFGGAYSGLDERRQHLVNDWVARFVKTTGQTVEAGTFHDTLLSLSTKTMFEADIDVNYRASSFPCGTVQRTPDIVELGCARRQQLRPAHQSLDRLRRTGGAASSVSIQAGTGTGVGICEPARAPPGRHGSATRTSTSWSTTS